MRKAKACMELNVASDVRGTEKGFYRYIGSKTRENVGLVLNGMS